MSQWNGKPVRLQLRRTKGFNLQVASVSINGRQAVNCARPGPYGNRHKVGPDLSAATACARFKADVKKHNGIVRLNGKIIPIWLVKKKLAGKNLACFCALSAKHCHVDIVLEVANGD